MCVGSLVVAFEIYALSPAVTTDFYNSAILALSHSLCPYTVLEMGKFVLIYLTGAFCVEICLPIYHF